MAVSTVEFMDLDFSFPSTMVGMQSVIDENLIVVEEDASSVATGEGLSDQNFVVETFKLGSRYEGYKLNGMRHGQGKFYYQDGGLYDGDWFENRMQGQGKLYYQSGKLAFEGSWH